MKNYQEIINESLHAAQNLENFNDRVIESIQALNWNWNELGFTELDNDQTFFIRALGELEFLPIKDESLYSEKFLDELRAKEKWFRQNYKEETQKIGQRLTIKLREMLRTSRK